MRKKGNSILLEITAALMLIVVLVSGGCSRGGGEVVQIDDRADGSTIKLSVGQELEVSLESNPSTGYSWQLGTLEGDVMEQKGDVEFTSDSDLLGAAGMEAWRFTAEKAGTTTLNLIYIRVWEEGVSPLNEFSVTVVVE